MKTNIKVMVIFLVLFFSLSLYAQNPPHPNGGGGPGGGNVPVGGGAPLEDGWIVLFGLALGYGSYKVLSLNSKIRSMIND